MSDTPEMQLVRLPCCEYAVFSSGRPDYQDDCGDPATHKASWDGGQNWLHLCAAHARVVEEAEEEKEADDGAG